MSSSRFLHTIEIRSGRAARLFGSGRRLDRFTLDMKGDWQLYFDSGSGVAARLVSAWVFAGRLLALSWQVTPGGDAGSTFAGGKRVVSRRVNAWVFRHGVHGDSWRRLMVRLRLPVKPAGAGRGLRI